MKTEKARRCSTCQGMDLVIDAERDTCKYCGAATIELVELPPRPARRRHEEAYRSRAGMVGELLSCICTYPLDVDDSTVSGHDPRCPSESMARKRIELEEARAARPDPQDFQQSPPPEDEDLPPWERVR